MLNQNYTGISGKYSAAEQLAALWGNLQELRSGNAELI